jgi:hypothetical protein
MTILPLLVSINPAAAIMSTPILPGGTVNIGNLPTVQLVQDADHPVNGIYQHVSSDQLQIGDTIANFSFPDIPQDQVLIVEYVSIRFRVPDGSKAACFPDFRMGVSNLGRFTLPVTFTPSPFSEGLLAVVATPMTAYHSATPAAPAISCFFTEVTQGHSAIAEIVGHTVQK